jgi:hypothetical protein
MCAIVQVQVHVHALALAHTHHKERGFLPIGLEHFLFSQKFA